MCPVWRCPACSMAAPLVPLRWPCELKRGWVLNAAERPDFGWQSKARMTCIRPRNGSSPPPCTFNQHQPTRCPPCPIHTGRSARLQASFALRAHLRQPKNRAYCAVSLLLQRRSGWWAMTGSYRRATPRKGADPSTSCSGLLRHAGQQQPFPPKQLLRRVRDIGKCDMPNFGGFSRFSEHHLSVLYPYRHKKSTERFH